jgi:dTDP-4-amino-4,6-dideoxygalactose transaminase
MSLDAVTSPRSATEFPKVHEAEAIPEAARAEIERILSTGDLFRYTSENSPCMLLEQEFAQMMGSKYALAVSSCSAALFLSLKALDLPAGARVAIPGFTFAAVPSSIVHAECVPVLVECGSDYRICLDDLEAKIDSCDAIIVSHMRGHTSDMDAIMAMAEARDIPVIEDAAHSLGTLWDGQKIGTIGKIGCFSFQSYKLLNAGEGGIMITDDAELVARAIIMSGAYEHNWRKHDVVEEACARWQNKLPLYNLRLNTLSAALVRSQLPELERRVSDGRRNHDYVAERLNTSPYIDVPKALPKELRAPDSIQFNLTGLSEDQIRAYAKATKEAGITVQVFGLSADNARAFWNWDFLPETFDLPRTRTMLMTACDARLPARLTLAECDMVVDALLDALSGVTA